MAEPKTLTIDVDRLFKNPNWRRGSLSFGSNVIYFEPQCEEIAIVIDRCSLDNEPIKLSVAALRYILDQEANNRVRIAYVIARERAALKDYPMSAELAWKVHDRLRYTSPMPGEDGPYWLLNSL